MRLHPLHAAVALALLAIPASGQHVLFEEDFEKGIPSTWTNVQRAYLGDIWMSGFQLVDATNDVNHEWFCDIGSFFRDNLLVSPPIDLTGASAAFVEFGQWQIFPLQRQYNGVEISTDGGMTFNEVYRETGTWTGFGSVKVDISKYVGQPDVRIAFHYQGTIANDWSVDNVRVTTAAVEHRITDLVAGQTAKFRVERATPGNGILMAVSFQGAGPLPTPWGNLNLSPPIVFFPVVVADPMGEAELPIYLPPIASGVTVYSQAIEFALPSTIKITNSLAPTIE